MAVPFMFVLLLSKFFCYTLAVLDSADHLEAASNAPQPVDDLARLDDTVWITPITPITPTDDQSQLTAHAIRYKRNAHNHDKSFMRFVRNSDSYDRKSAKSLIRFGRNESPAKSNGFIRFGRSDKSFMRIGRDDNSEAIRFGRRGDKFIRFGRNGAAVSIVSPNRPITLDELIRSANERSAESSIDELDGAVYIPVQTPLTRLGRNGNANFIRFGRRDSIIRLGKKNTKPNTVGEKIPNVDTNDLDENQSDEYGAPIDIMSDDGSSPAAAHSGKALQSAGNDDQPNENRDKFLSMLGTDYL